MWEVSKEIFPKGEYEFKVVWAKDGISKAGNGMIEIVHHVFNDGKTIKVYDYLLEAMHFETKTFFAGTTGA